MRAHRVRIEWIAWCAALIPLVSANACYLISASHELVPWCFPYLEGCSSISKAARQAPANLLFKATMLPYTAVLMLMWWLTSEWLRELAPQWRTRRRAMLTLGEIGALFLLLYATFLGVDGETYQWLRRYGINVYFSFTALAQILLVSMATALPAKIRRAMLALTAVVLVLGLASLPLQFIVTDREALLNSLEWTVALLMTIYFPLVGVAWRRTGFTLRPTLQ